jgi:hypothetical protein
MKLNNINCWKMRTIEFSSLFLLVYCLVFCNVLHPCLDDGHGEFDDDVKVVEMLSHMQWSK